MALNTSRAEGKTGPRLGMRIMIIAAVILFLCLLAVFLGGKKPWKEGVTITQQKTDSSLVGKKSGGAAAVVPAPDTTAVGRHEADTAKSKPVENRHLFARGAKGGSKARIDSAKNAAATADSAKIADAKADSSKTALAAADSIKAASADSEAVFFGSINSTDCTNDTTAPWVYPEPSGGLFHGPLSIRFLSNKKSAVSWRMGTDTLWQRYDDKAISIEKTTTISFRAKDRCGQTMKERQEYYEIDRSASTGACPQGMDLVKIGTMRFCIDRYEWPNRKGVVPQSYVTLYQARDSCFTAGKQLCTSEEWSLACSGPYSWKYPYGQNYESRACVTSDMAPGPSGSKPECRAFFGAFDMSGNLLEWTNTTSRGAPGFYNVLGGFWQSGVRSGCFDIRSSYFPQNRHNPVGFRCCKDVPEGK